MNGFSAKGASLPETLESITRSPFPRPLRFASPVLSLTIGSSPLSFSPSLFPPFFFVVDDHDDDVVTEFQRRPSSRARELVRPPSRTTSNDRGNSTIFFLLSLFFRRSRASFAFFFVTSLCNFVYVSLLERDCRNFSPSMIFAPFK